MGYLSQLISKIGDKKYLLLHGLLSSRSLLSLKSNLFFSEISSPFSPIYPFSSLPLLSLKSCNGPARRPGSTTQCDGLAVARCVGKVVDRLDGSPPPRSGKHGGSVSRRPTTPPRSSKAAQPGRNREHRCGSSKTATTTAWVQAPPRSSKVAQHGHDREADLHRGGRRLLLPLCVVDSGSILDLQRRPTNPPLSLRGLWPPPSSMPRSRPSGFGSELMIFLFLKIDFVCQSATIDTKKRLFFVSVKWYRLAQPIPITSCHPI
jgi:hypothetical protein